VGRSCPAGAELSTGQGAVPVGGWVRRFIQFMVGLYGQRKWMIWG